MDRPQFGQVFRALGRRNAFLPQRARADQPGRGDAEGLQPEGPLRSARPKRPEQLALPGHRQRLVDTDRAVSCAPAEFRRGPRDGCDAYPGQVGRLPAGQPKRRQESGRCGPRETQPGGSLAATLPEPPRPPAHRGPDGRRAHGLRAQPARPEEPARAHPPQRPCTRAPDAR